MPWWKRTSSLARTVTPLVFHARRQRCQVHKLRNILAKLPKAIRAEMARLVGQVFHAATYDDGLRRGRALIARFTARYPSAMACLEDDLEACLIHLQFPREHHVRLRTTNLLERTFGEGRRRTKVVGRFPTEAACLQLLFATLITASRTWRGVPMTPAILRQLDALRSTLLRSATGGPQTVTVTGKVTEAPHGRS